jgi:hypothetical protein
MGAGRTTTEEDPYRPTVRMRAYRSRALWSVGRWYDQTIRYEVRATHTSRINHTARRLVASE